MMKLVRLAAISGSLLLLPTASLGAKEHHMSSHTIDFSSARRLHTDRVEIFHVSDTITSRTPIVPEKLELSADVVKHTVTGTTHIDSIFEHITEAKPSEAARTAEYRWKLVFFDTRGSRISEIYASGIAPYGMIDGRAVIFANGSLQHWLRKQYAPKDAAFFKKFKA